MKVSDAILKRFACKSFKPESNVEENDLKEILALTQRAPTCFNTQPWVAVVVRRGTVENSGLVSSAFATNQERIRQAPTTVLFCADLEPLRNLDRIAQLSEQQGYDPQEAKAKLKKPLAAVAYHVKPINWVLMALKALLLPLIGFWVPVMTAMIGESARTWAIKQTMFAASTFVLASSGYGYDTSIMEGFDSNRARKVVGLPKRYVPCLLVSIGNASQKKPKTLAPRFDPRDVYFDGHATKPFQGIKTLHQTSRSSSLTTTSVRSKDDDDTSSAN